MNEHDHEHDHDHEGHDHEGHDHDHDHDHSDEARDEARERAARRQVALAQVRQYGDPVLRMKAYEVEQFDDELEQLSERMIALMHDADGIGLAATQVGVVRRLFVFSHEGEDRVVVNPVLTRGKDTEVDEEGCLSLGPVRMPVERSVKVTLDGVDVGGEPLHLELEGLPARVVQHESDHLDGTLIIDRTDPESRREAMAQLRPRLLLSR